MKHSLRSYYEKMKKMRVGVIFCQSAHGVSPFFVPESGTFATKTVVPPASARVQSGVSSCILFFSVTKRTIVNIALAVQDTSELSHTPFNSRKGTRINNETIGNTSVPKKDVSIDRAGRSSAVK